MIVALGWGSHGMMLASQLGINMILVPRFDTMALEEFWEITQGDRPEFLIGVGKDRKLVEAMWTKAVGLSMTHLGRSDYRRFTVELTPIPTRLCQLADGCVVMPHVTINSDVVIGQSCLLNSGCIIEHDCVVGDFAHIAPGAVLLGGVTVGARATVGANATVLPGLVIGDDAVVGAGAVVTKSVAPATVVVGNPARVLRERSP